MRLQQLPALRAVYKLKHDWTQYMRDMKEIMVPSSMPDDPPITATLRRQPWEIVSVSNDCFLGCPPLPGLSLLVAPETKPDTIQITAPLSGLRLTANVRAPL